MSDEPSPYTEADVERVADALKSRCPLCRSTPNRCAGHPVDARAALRALAEAGRLLPERVEMEWRGLIIDMATDSLVSTWPVLGWPSDEASVRSEAERYKDDERFRVAFERRIVGPWQPIAEETDKP